jgi:hypothetical protein
MKRILYLNRKPNGGTIAEILRHGADELVASCSYADALEMFRSHSFDAVVIGDEDENIEVLDFTIQAHRMQPDLPLFLESDWGSDLGMALESMGESGELSPSNAWRSDMGVRI